METHDRQEEIDEIDAEATSEGASAAETDFTPEASELPDPEAANESSIEPVADDESVTAAEDESVEVEDELPPEPAAEMTESPESAIEDSEPLTSMEEPQSATAVMDLLPADEAAADGETGDEAEEDQTPYVEEPDDDRAWYVVHCYSGYENKVRHNLEQRIETMGMKDRIFDVVVPTEEEIEVKEGKRRTVERRVFPGYILVNMIMTEESWYVVRNTPGVTGFVGQGNTPIPLRPEEVAQIIKRMEAEAPRIKVTFKSGERVRIIDGPFNDFRGTVSEIDMERAKVRVMVNFFGRETPVELDFLQVEKA